MSRWLRIGLEQTLDAIRIGDKMSASQYLEVELNAPKLPVQYARRPSLVLGSFLCFAQCQYVTRRPP